MRKVGVGREGRSPGRTVSTFMGIKGLPGSTRILKDPWTLKSTLCRNFGYAS